MPRQWFKCEECLKQDIRSNVAEQNRSEICITAVHEQYYPAEHLCILLGNLEASWQPVTQEEALKCQG